MSKETRIYRLQSTRINDNVHRRAAPGRVRAGRGRAWPRAEGTAPATADSDAEVSEFDSSSGSEPTDPA